MANVFRVGNLEVLVVSDGSAKAPGTYYFSGTTAEQWEPHKRWLDHEGNVVFPFGCFLIRSGDKRILIDTGIGPVELWGFKGGELLGELAAVGVKAEDIDIVFVTHLHFDHCGSCALPVDGAPKATFPNASYRWTSAEDAYWRSGKPARDISERIFSRKDMLDALAPRFESADEGAVLAPGVNVIALPGHTPGHAGIVLSSGEDRAFILGDAIGCPVQLEQPEWSGLGDVDPKLARRTQEAVAREAEGSGALVGASHCPGLTFGRVLQGGGRRFWQAL